MLGMLQRGRRRAQDAGSATENSTSADNLPPGVRVWNEQHVAAWLASQSKKLGELGESFIANGIDGQTLLELDDETINALIPEAVRGATVLRRSLKSKIESLKNPQQGASQPIPEGVVSYNVVLPNQTTVQQMVSPNDRLTLQSTVEMVKRAITSKAQWNWDANRTVLQYNGTNLDLNSTLAQSRVPRTGQLTVEIVKALPRDNPLVIIAYGVDLISQEEGNHAKMPCGHVISCQSLTQYVRSLTQNFGQTNVTCPGVTGIFGGSQCGAVWDWPLCRTVGQFTLDECKEFEEKFGRNMLNVSFGDTRECPKCHVTICKEEGLRSNRVRCPNCARISREAGEELQDFCWICLRAWRGRDGKCGNDGCDPIGALNQTLGSCGTKDISYGSVTISNVPEIRACPTCRALIYHVRACKHMRCKVCKQQFCFSCLKKKDASQSWSSVCSNGIACEVHPKQSFS